MKNYLVSSISKWCGPKISIFFIYKELLKQNKNGCTIPLKLSLSKQFLFYMHACIKVPAGASIYRLFSVLSKCWVEFIDPRRTAALLRQILIKVTRKMVSQQLSAMLTIKQDIWEVMDVSATLFYSDWIHSLLQDLIKYAVMGNNVLQQHCLYWAETM